MAISFPLDSNQWPNFRSYGWDPTSSKIAYEDTFVLGTADLLGSPHTVIYNGWANTPQWSPDGKKIMFMNVNFGISTIGPDGKLSKGSQTGEQRGFRPGVLVTHREQRRLLWNRRGHRHFSRRLKRQLPH